ncbi:MAG: serine/threonine-protein kinase [Oscillatoria sp. PMC 1051.18]|nr:serine/threonine-protein kinase [Oscillatoria sp. PMC 1050.18]MEC5033049.1 serine/threonine-protein kinase [Oscillatoria sp. PMC 1051.18]
METLQHRPEEIIAQRYRIVTPLGTGSAGTTYEAEDLSNYRRIALKALRVNQIRDWKTLELFEREAKILANLNHPHIPKYLDYFEAYTGSDRQIYLVQELATGESLADLIAKGWHPDEAEVKRIAIQILSILDYLHTLTPPILHRDIKPQNLIRQSDGKIFLVDFGAVQDIYRNTLTRGGTFVGTFGYIPPEQFRGTVVPASDLYSLGSTLVFLLTGRNPGELEKKRLKIEFRSQVKISTQFGDWLEKMLEPTLEDRFSSAKLALKALQSNQRIPRSPSQELQPPINSRIVLNRTNKKLVADILPLHSGWMITVIVLLLLNGFLWLINSYLAAAGISWTYLLPIWIIVGCLLPLPEALWSSAGSRHLEIDRHKFRLQWRLGNISIREQKGRTADICQIEVEDSRFIIWQGVRQKGFNYNNLRQEEMNWLAAQITDFLQQIQ